MSTIYELDAEIKNLRAAKDEADRLIAQLSDKVTGLTEKNNDLKLQLNRVKQQLQEANIRLTNQCRTIEELYAARRVKAAGNEDTDIPYCENCKR